MPPLSPRSYFLAPQRLRSGLGKPGIRPIRLGPAVSGARAGWLGWHSRLSLLRPKKTDEGDRIGPGAPCFLRSMKGEPSRISGPPEPRNVAGLGSIRPTGTSANKLGAAFRSRIGVAAASLPFEWIARGLTAVCFWTAPRRLIAALEDRVRFGLAGLCPARPSPNRCLAGLLSPSCPTEN